MYAILPYENIYHSSCKIGVGGIFLEKRNLNESTLGQRLNWGSFTHDSSLKEPIQHNICMFEVKMGETLNNFCQGKEDSCWNSKKKEGKDHSDFAAYPYLWCQVCSWYSWIFIKWVLEALELQHTVSFFIDRPRLNISDLSGDNYRIYVLSWMFGNFYFKDGECMVIVITIPSYTFISVSPMS